MSTTQNPKELVELAERQLIQLSETIAVLKRTIEELSDENNRLTIANTHLQALVVEKPIHSSEVEGTLQDQGSERLRSFYREGIHICHPFFGARREPGEECMFCQGVLDSMQK